MFIWGPSIPSQSTPSGALPEPFRNPHPTPLMEAYNNSMSSVRVSVEWLFGDIVDYFKFMDFKKNLKIGMSSIGKMYIVCALLQNALSLLIWQQYCHRYFDLEPPPSRTILHSLQRELQIKYALSNLENL